MAGIRDVAKEAGVASCTVSRMLNGTANVMPETREKIEKAMEKLNYVPNELARGMFKGKSSTIAMLVPSIQHPWFSSLADVIEKELYERGYKLMLLCTSASRERELACFQMLRSNIVDGIICGTTSCNIEDYLRVDKPMVMLDYKVGKKFPAIVSDHEMGAKLAAEEFDKSSCNYVIHICGVQDNPNIISFRSHTKLDEILAEHHIRSRQVPIRWNDFDFDGYFELVKCILEEYEQVDGIMAADFTAIAFSKAAASLGRRIPEDLAIISYDGTFVTKTGTIKFTTVYQNYMEIAHKAVDTLFRIMQNGNEEQEEEILVPVWLESGDTTVS
ncbi:MAG: LacI family DNA-binding transcriptional regulator [Clostridiales bacterium]|nr:LacI family DNA-binding transcriptional regulator [Clostridiales bacterium]